MARKSNIEKAAETGDWSKLERTARKALRKSGAVLGHSRADPEAEQEIEAAEVESEDPSIEEILDPGNDAEDEMDEPEEPQDDEDGAGDEDDKPGYIDQSGQVSETPVKPPLDLADIGRLVSRVSSTSQYYLAGRSAAEEQAQLEEKWADFPKWLSDRLSGPCPPTSQELQGKLDDADRQEALEARMRALPAKERLLPTTRMSTPADWERHREWFLTSALHETDLRFGHPKKAPNRQISFPYYGYEPLKAGRPRSDKKMTATERKRLQRAKDRERKKIAEQSARLAHLSARLEKFRPAVAA